MKKVIALFICFLSLVLTNFGWAQEEKPLEGEEVLPPKFYKLPTIGLGYGMLVFNGDIVGPHKLSGSSRINHGYNVYVEQRFNAFDGVYLNFLSGALASYDQTSHLGFKSKLTQVDIGGVFHFDNKRMIRKNSVVAPFLALGVGYTIFNPHGDLKDKNGKAYNYWSDGSIRDLPQNDTNIYKSRRVSKDNVYETQLKDSLVNYKRSGLSFPLTLGVTLKLTPAITSALTATYYITTTDWIDNVKKGGNDAFFNANVSIRINIGGIVKPPQDPKFKDVDFSSIDNTDYDGDGVKDKDDECPSTGKGAKVDTKGCPLDDDKDGVPNSLDKEPKTKTGTLVDVNGVTITDAMLEQMAKDTLTTLHSDAADMMKRQDAKILPNKPRLKLPPQFKPFDNNNDGIITSNEITAAIDAFFEGGQDITVDKINKLIDYFFEQ